MKSTMAYAAKRALFAALVNRTGLTQPLEGVQVSYDYPADELQRTVIYGGGVRFTHVDAAGEQGLIADEAVTVGMYIRVLRPGESIATCEQAIESIADVIGDIFEAQPALGGTMTWLGITSGAGDYARTQDGPEAVLSLQVMVGAVLT